MQDAGMIIGINAKRASKRPSAARVFRQEEAKWCGARRRGAVCSACSPAGKQKNAVAGHSVAGKPHTASHTKYVNGNDEHIRTRVPIKGLLFLHFRSPNIKHVCSESI